MSPTNSRFQVDLRGLIDLLSHHLYSGPTVFIRELLQNGVDAILARQQVEPGFSGTVRIEVVGGDKAPPTLVFQDDGIGLTQEQAHQFLATIGKSSKRGESVIRPEGFLGQFGIGLLSCFMVSDEIVVVARSALDGNQPAVEWRGCSDGTYAVRVLDKQVPIGTQVFLRAKRDAEELFDPLHLLSLVRHYGEFLEPTIEFQARGWTEQVNTTAPWNHDPDRIHDRERLLAYGRTAFERDFLDVFPIRSPAGGAQGTAYVLATPARTDGGRHHRVYLKNMLLATRSDALLPDWAFFVQCVVNSNRLTPTASREAFQDDQSLESTRRELGACLRRYLIDKARHQPEQLRRLVDIHHLALKALAIEDDECLQLFADWLPFETSLGAMLLGEFIRENPVIRYVPTRDQFRQISHVAASESLAVVNAGYVYDVEILKRVGMTRPGVDVQEFDVAKLSNRFEALSFDERQKTVELERLADTVLQPFKCAVEVTKYRPVELPALYVANADADFLRSVDHSQDVADELWTGILDNISRDVLPTAYARLHLNYLNPLIQRIASLRNLEAQRRSVEMLYIQSLLLGHFALKAGEVKLLNEGLLGLLNWALEASEKGTR